VWSAGAPLTGEQHARERGSETAIGAQPGSTGGRQVVAPPRSIPATLHEPLPLAHPECAMKDRLTRRVATQSGNLPGGAPVAKRPAVDGIEDGKLHRPKRI
jgi:hypothetical protein